MLWLRVSVMLSLQTASDFFFALYFRLDTANVMFRCQAAHFFAFESSCYLKSQDGPAFVFAFFLSFPISLYLFALIFLVIKALMMTADRALMYPTIVSHINASAPSD